jgi:hypothetical protein
MSKKTFKSFLIISVVAVILTALLGGNVLLPAETANADTIVAFPDPGLNAAIRDAINKPAGDIYENDLISLTILDASDKNIIDLTGLQYCTGLQYLYLNNNQINDISSLQNLTSLQFLDLGFNQICDIAPLSNLTKLGVLILQCNRISDISSLDDLTNLYGLYLAGNQIDDISSLVINTGLDSGDNLQLQRNKLYITGVSQNMADIQTLIGRGVQVEYKPQNNSLYNLIGKMGSETISAGGQLFLRSNQFAHSDITFPAGDWFVSIHTDSFWGDNSHWGDRCRIEVGEWDSDTSTFTPYNLGVSSFWSGSTRPIILRFQIATASVTIHKTKYLGFKIYNDHYIDHIVYTGGGSFFVVPQGSPDFPIPEMATLILLGLGLTGLGTYVLGQRRKARAQI